MSRNNESTTIKMEGLRFERGMEIVGDFHGMKEGHNGVAIERRRKGKFVEYKRVVVGVEN
jgi:hypothetical protein